MSKPISFGSPILLEKLEKKYGSQQTSQPVPIRQTQDVTVFLESKREAEKKTAEEKLFFK
jgi:hypothetical protein